MDNPTISPEQKLWLAVFNQSAADVAGRHRDIHSRNELEKADNWIGTTDMKKVCELAGICPEMAQETLERMKEERNVSDSQ